jgi:ABC-type xylose transport system permease subunit
LFPRWVKYAGVVVFFVSVIIPFYTNLLIEGKNYLGVTFANLGLFLICFSRDKLEDEMSNLIRLKSFYRSVALGFVYVFVFTAIDFILGNTFDLIPAVQLVTFILLVYLANYYITKSKIRSAK